jgi:hypothetical protein
LEKGLIIRKHIQHEINVINPLKPKRNLSYLNIQFVPRRKQSPFRLQQTSAVAPGYNDIGFIQHFVGSVTYYVEAINFSLLTVTLYSSVRKTLAYNDTTKYSVPFMTL